MARRHTTRLPIIITESVYARAAIAAEIEGTSIAEYTEQALTAAITLTQGRELEAQYAQACRDAHSNRKVAPTRWEFFGDRQSPFVRRSAGETSRHAGRPSSRHHQEAGEHRAGQWRAAGPEPRAARMREHGEDPPVEGPEHSGSSSISRLRP